MTDASLTSCHGHRKYFGQHNSLIHWNKYKLIIKQQQQHKYHIIKYQITNHQQQQQQKVEKIKKKKIKKNYISFISGNIKFFYF